ncbi:MAG: hypothetical protein WCQ21_22870 [Verrucomicrobiota bacterium]
MKINPGYIGSLAAALLIGAAAAFALTDYALQTGFPDKLYIVNVKFTGTPEDSFICTQYANRFGLGTLSEFDAKTKVQQTCAIEVAGTPQPDGSFDAANYPMLMMGRLLRRGGTFHLKANRIETIKPMEPIKLLDFVGHLFGFVNLP